MGKTVAGSQVGVTEKQDELKRSFKHQRFLVLHFRFELAMQYQIDFRVFVVFNMQYKRLDDAIHGADHPDPESRADRQTVNCYSGFHGNGVQFNLANA